MKNSKKLIIAGLCIATSATIVLTACGGSNAARVAQTSTNSAKRVDSIVKSLDTVSDSQFKFPTAFGDDFFVAQNTITAVDNQPLTKNSRRIDFKRPNRYESRHFEISSLNQENSKREEYMNRLDDLYILCADISAANAQISERTNEIKTENAEMKRLSKEFKKIKTTSEKYNEIKKKNDELKRNLKKLKKDRKSIKNRVNAIPSTNDSINIETASLRYNIIMNKIENRLKLLDEVKANICGINESMRSVINTSSTQTEGFLQNKTFKTPKRKYTRPEQINENQNITEPQTEHMQNIQPITTLVQPEIIQPAIEQPQQNPQESMKRPERQRNLQHVLTEEEQQEYIKKQEENIRKIHERQIQRLEEVRKNREERHRQRRERIQRAYEERQQQIDNSNIPSITQTETIQSA